MDQASGKTSSTASQNEICQLADELFRGAAAKGRKQLDQAELNRLLAALGLPLTASGKADHTAIDLRISLNRTREFGMVLSAGLGGLDAELDEGNFRRDRASVYAAAELTDADDFLALFKRTLAWQRLAARARRDGGAAPDAALRGVFAKLLALAAGPWSAGDLVPQCLELNPVGAADALTVPLRVRAFCFAPPAASDTEDRQTDPPQIDRHHRCLID